jgi:hypothetical protein
MEFQSNMIINRHTEFDDVLTDEERSAGHRFRTSLDGAERVHGGDLMGDQVCEFFWPLAITMITSHLQIL